MKKQALIIVLAALLFACNSSETSKETELPVVDVNKEYPEKEINFQDVFDVEYIPLETRDDVLLEDWVGIDYESKDTIIITNRKQGDIFIFDGKGKFLSKFNKKGQSGEEYTYLGQVVYTPGSKEIFIFDKWGKKKVFVYDLKGTFKRSFDISKKYAWENVTDYNDSLFICYDVKYFDFVDRSEDDKKDEKEENPKNFYPYIFISKTDGHYVSSVDLEIKEKMNIVVAQKFEGGGFAIYYDSEKSFLKLKNDWLIASFSLDTFYLYTPDKQLVPFLAKQPAIQSMPKDKKVWLGIKAVTPNYLFVQKAHKTGKTKGKFDEVIKQTSLCIDRKTNEVYKYKFVYKDYKNQDGYRYKSYAITPDKLLDALEEGNLAGKLKELAEKIDADDNQVFVRVSVKKKP